MVNILIAVMLLFSFLDKGNTSNTIKEIAVTGVEKNELILNAQKISFAGNDLIYLTDKIFCRFNVYNKKLKFLSSFGEKGKISGKFKAPSQITTNKEYIVIADFASSRVQVFGINNTPLCTFYTDGPVFSLSFDNKGYLLIGVYTGKKDKALFKYSVKGEKLETILLKNTVGDPFKDIFKFTIMPNGYVAITYLVQNVIEILDPKYHYFKTINIEKLPHQPEYTTLDKGLIVPNDNLIQSVASDSKSRIFVLASDYVKLPRREVYVYDLLGKLLNSFTLPDKADEIFIDNEDNLYTIEKSRTILKKYKIRV